MRNSKRFVRTVLIVLFAAGVLSLTGCGRTDDGSGQVDSAVPYEISEAEPKSMETQTDAGTAQTQDDVQEQDGSICGAYSLSGDLDTHWDIDDFVWYEH